MKNISTILLSLLLLFSCQKSENNSADSHAKPMQLFPYDYFETEVPFSTTIYELSGNHDREAALGRLLFYDNRLSQNNSISCANCHQQSKGFSDNETFSRGLKNKPTLRNAMSLVNNAYQSNHFWEAHVGTLDKHILDPVSNHIEMGMRNLDELVIKLSGIEDYQKLFQQVYGKKVSEHLIQKSIATFVASMISYESKFDKGQKVNFTNFTANELAGKDLFFGKAKCAECHDGQDFSSTWRRHANIGLDMEYIDQGAGNGRFKIPSLRNIELTGPYMHDGRFKTLEEVIDHYTSGVKKHPFLDWTLQTGIELNDHEKKFLVEFLKTLTDYEFINHPKWSDPFL